MKRALFSLLALAFLAPAAYAGAVTYVLPTPGVF